MMKCFWCGAENRKDQTACDKCGRKLLWTMFFRGVLRPSVGCLLGSDQTRNGGYPSGARIQEQSDMKRRSA